MGKVSETLGPWELSARAWPVPEMIVDAELLAPRTA